LLKRLSFLHCMFSGAVVKNMVGIAVWIHLWFIYSIPLVFLLFLCQYCAVFIAIAL
jgi:hypothetical protein